METKDLANVLEGLKEQGKTLYIIGHRGFCYDTLGSAFGLMHIARHHGLEAKVCGEFTQDWGYPQNNILYNELNLSTSISPPETIGEKDAVAYVDVFPGGANCYDVNGRACIVINHHPVKDAKSDLSKIPFVDCKEAGSNIAIVVEHMMNTGIELTESDRHLATLMLYGLRVDTKTYLQAKDIDFDASKYLTRHADLEMVERIALRKRPAEVLNILKQMKERDVVKYRIAVFNCNSADIVPHMADMLVDFEGYPISIVVAYVNDKDGNGKWYVRGRSRKPEYDSSQILKEIFGPTAGGHWHSSGVDLETDKVFSLFGIDVTEERSVLTQLLDSLEAKLKKRSNER
jgi:nanoRNase/pAp phosphatase (c-di-AMP/oligoRNAs hydrolase)